MKFIFLLLTLTLINTTSFAKSNEIPNKIEPKLLNPQKKSEKSEIKPFDVQKLFEEAETYYKAAKAWKKLKCTAKTSFVCNKKECNKREAKSSLILDRKKEMIYRCEGKVCDEIPAQFKQTGVFITVQSEGIISTLIRILGDSRYKEIATVGLDAYIANGECEIVKED